MDFGADKVTIAVRGPVFKVERPRCLVFKRNTVDAPTWVGIVDISFEAAEEGTVIRLRESGYPNTPVGLHALLKWAACWGDALTLWRFHLEHGISY